MSRGDCHLCGETYTKRGMSRHLRACLRDSPGDEEFGDEYDFGSTTALEVRVADAGGWSG